jgi:hypothetical protein
LVDEDGPLLFERDAGLDLVENLDRRREAGLERMLAEDPLREGVQRRYGGVVDLVERRVQRRVRARRALELGADAVAQLRGGGLGEGDGGDTCHRHAGLDERDDARHELGGLAGAGAGLDEDRLPQPRPDAVPRCRVVRRTRVVRRSRVARRADAGAHSSASASST